jgi:hypothetical protein
VKVTASERRKGDDFAAKRRAAVRFSPLFVLIVSLDADVATSTENGWRAESISRAGADRPGVLSVPAGIRPADKGCVWRGVVAQLCLTGLADDKIISDVKYWEYLQQYQAQRIQVRLFVHAAVGLTDVVSGQEIEEQRQADIRRATAASVALVSGEYASFLLIAVCP